MSARPSDRGQAGAEGAAGSHGAPGLAVLALLVRRNPSWSTVSWAQVAKW